MIPGVYRIKTIELRNSVTFYYTNAHQSIICVSNNLFFLDLCIKRTAALTPGQQIAEFDILKDIQANLPDTEKDRQPAAEFIGFQVYSPPSGIVVHNYARMNYRGKLYNGHIIPANTGIIYQGLFSIAGRNNT